MPMCIYSYVFSPCVTSLRSLCSSFYGVTCNGDQTGLNWCKKLLASSALTKLSWLAGCETQHWACQAKGPGRLVKEERAGLTAGPACWH